MRKGFKKNLFVFLGAVTVLLIFCAGFRLGLSERTTNPSEDELFFADQPLFKEAVRVIREKHIEGKKIGDEDLLYGAVKGIVNALEDPYSVFFSPSDAKKFEEDISGTFGGIGAEIGVRGNQLLIIAPLKNNPAEAAGLRAGDKILKIDDTFTLDLTVDEAVKLIRGEPGTKVKLLILRDEWKEPKELEVERKIIVVPTLDWEMKEGNAAYFALHNFNGNASSDFRRAAFFALLKGAKGMILDLRNNPGGFLDVAVDVGGWFLNHGELVVREKFGNGEERKLVASGNSALARIPIVVLINEGSASASEILAGALRDNRGAKLVGEKTFGKGTVQEIVNLKDGSVIKISIAEWFTPKGEAINKKGLAPDIEVKMAEEDIEKGNDPQLQKALEILREEISKV